MGVKSRAIVGEHDSVEMCIVVPVYAAAVSEAEQGARIGVDTSIPPLEGFKDCCATLNITGGRNVLAAGLNAADAVELAQLLMSAVAAWIARAREPGDAKQ